jgi:hypothetical protein
MCMAELTVMNSPGPELGLTRLSVLYLHVYGGVTVMNTP